MTARAVQFRQAGVTRAIKGVQAAGLPVAGCSVDPLPGEIRVWTTGQGQDGACAEIDDMIERAT